MTLRIPRAWGLLGVLLVALPSAHAQIPPLVRTEIEYLLSFIGESGCDFERNGRWYDSTTARNHLRRKYDWLVKHDQVETTEDFIDKAATRSSLSGEPYRIRCKGSPVVETSPWLRIALARYRVSAAH